MPVISTRRSSATSGSFYVTPAASSASTELTGSSSYLDRGTSLSKALPTSSYSYGFFNSNSYTPRTTSTYRSSSSSGATAYTAGVFSKYSSYTPSSTYLSSNNDSTISSRYGLKTRLHTKDAQRNDGHRETSSSKSSHSISDSSKSSNRLSNSYSSSSLARLVATSGLDLYEKYSPAHYIPKCEVSRSRPSASEAISSLADSIVVDDASDAFRPKDRYGRFDNNNVTNNSHTHNSSDDVVVSATRQRSSKTADQLLNSSSSPGSLKCSLNNVSTNVNNNSSANNTSSNKIDKSLSEDVIPTYTVYSNRLRSSAPRATINADGDDENTFRNGSATEKNSNCTDRITAARNHLKDLSLSSSSAPSWAGAGAGEKDATDYTPTATATNIITLTNCSNGSGRNSNETATTAASKLDATASTLAAGGSKIRSSSTLRSALPPPSPTPSRYRDRDSNRITYTEPSYTDAGKSSDEKTEGLCGLRNIGNTCFMNSVIQCLSHTIELTKFLRAHSGAKAAVSKDQQILYEFAKLIREMWTTNVHSVTPLDLKRAFSTKHRMYSDYNQQDAQEFLRFFLDSLHCALNTGIKGGDHLKIDDNLSDNKKADLTWEWYTRHENSLIRDLFVGQLKSTLKCTTCGNTSVTFDPFWDLSVPLPSSSRCKLDSCLDLFIREEILDGDEMPTCSKCHTRRRCTKSFSIQRFPKYLVIHLKRFSETRWSKLSNIVEFPTGERELNMGPYGSNHHANVYYSLYGISNHMGSTAGGHYVALCKHPISKKWHEFNDNIVSDDLSENHLISSSAYILFYERA